MRESTATRQPKPRNNRVLAANTSWTPEEDEKLREMVGLHGTKDWVMISQLLGGCRKSKQVRERWINHVDPNVRKDPWTEEEDRLIASLQAKLGNSWVAIARHLPGRSDNSVKNRWNSSIKKRLQSGELRPGNLPRGHRPTKRGRYAARSRASSGEDEEEGEGAEGDDMVVEEEMPSHEEDAEEDEEEEEAVTVKRETIVVDEQSSDDEELGGYGSDEADARRRVRVVRAPRSIESNSDGEGSVGCAISRLPTPPPLPSPSAAARPRVKLARDSRHPPAAVPPMMPPPPPDEDALSDDCAAGAPAAGFCWPVALDEDAGMAHGADVLAAALLGEPGHPCSLPGDLLAAGPAPLPLPCVDPLSMQLSFLLASGPAYAAEAPFSFF